MITTMAFNDIYEVKEEIAKGGMSTVYLAEHKRLHTRLVIKEVQKRQWVKFDYLAEVNVLKHLKHSMIPHILDIFEDEDCVYIVEEYVEGITLEKLLKQKTRVDEAQGLQWFRELCTVLQYLHGQHPSIIYRDMKPSNIMLQPDGTLKLIDFGIAREYKKGSNADTVYIGTPEYAAPEQIGGKEQTTVRTDIYSLGVTMYHLLTGKAPYDPPYGFAPVRTHVPELSRGIEKILDKCIQPDPKNRYQTVTELLKDIEHISHRADAQKKTKSGKLRWVALIAAGLAVVIGMIIGIRALIRRAVSDETGDMGENIAATVKVESRVTEDVITEEGNAILTYTLSYPSVPELEQVDAYYLEQEQKRLAEIWEYQAVMYEMEYNTLANEPSFMPYAFETSYEVLRNDHELLSIIRMDDNYTGGMHGYCNFVAETFLVREQRVLTLDQLFTVPSEEYLPRILKDLVQQINKAAEENTALNHYSSWEVLKTVFNAEQFVVDDDALIFFFQEYEIGSYAAGAQNFRLAISDYMDILNSAWFSAAGGTMRVSDDESANQPEQSAQPTNTETVPVAVTNPISVTIRTQAELDALPLRKDADQIVTVEQSGGAAITNIGALGGLKNLTYLSLGGSKGDDSDIIGQLADIASLMGGTDIGDLSDLSGLNNLTHLSLGGVHIGYINALGDLTSLTYLSLHGTNISDLSALSGLKKLTYLSLQANTISDISDLSSLTNLTELNLGINNISDIGALSGLNNLTRLSLAQNDITDILALSSLTNLTDLDLRSNNINDISALSGLTNLSYLSLSDNYLSRQQIDELQVLLPNCHISY